MGIKVGDGWMGINIIFLKKIHRIASLTLSHSHTRRCRSHSLSLSQWLVNSVSRLASDKSPITFSLSTPTLPTPLYLCLSSPSLEVPLWQSDLSHGVTRNLSAVEALTTGFDSAFSFDAADNTSHLRSRVGLSDSPIDMVKVATIILSN
jgi:hypothetical protein